MNDNHAVKQDEGLFRPFFKLIIEHINLWVNGLGKASILVYSTVVSIFTPPFEYSLILKQLHIVGVRSFQVVLITGTVTGMIIALQSFYQLSETSTEGMTGAIVSVSIVKELSPIITAFVLSGRIGASITAEIGAMKVSEQIDAILAMGVSPAKYLVVPRLIGCLIMLPVLTIFADAWGFLGGFVIAVFLLSMNARFFVNQFRTGLLLNDIIIGSVKAAIFGVIIAFVGCYKGFAVKETSGAEGVGRATTSSTVMSLLLILMMNFFLDHLLYTVLGL
ncbi:TPA: ABC transporter permease [Candidatus Poribacteria bacterium]|nr:ABC transporter permease [Candidatus Poribacteria bacterium]